jgi:hypothetical protein
VRIASTPAVEPDRFAPGRDPFVVAADGAPLGLREFEVR